MTVIYSRTSDKKKRFSTAPMEREKPKQSAQSYCMWYLAKYETTAAMLRQKLLLRGYTAEESDAALKFVQDSNFQSDERYASMKARNTAHRAGNRKIAMALAQKGVDEETAQSQIADLAPEEERATYAATSKFSRHMTEEGMTPELQQKIWRFLGYRGFGGRAIKAAIDKLKEGG